MQNQTFWEPLVAKGTLDKEAEKEDDEDADPQMKEIEPDLPHMLPPSWCRAIRINQQQFESRSPNGCKIILYKRAKIELFAPHVKEDGLVKRITHYSDSKWQARVNERCVYSAREDLMYEKYSDFEAKVVREKFKSGRANSLKEHEYFMDTRYVSETDRKMKFHKDARADGLDSLTESPLSLTRLYCCGLFWFSSYKF